MDKTKLNDMLLECPICGVEPGHCHKPGCSVERCSVCGELKKTCKCEGHDNQFARWTGLFPGVMECHFLHIKDIHKDFYENGLYKIFFTKPK